MTLYFKKLFNPQNFFLLGIVLLPFIYWSRAQIPYEVPRVWFFQRWVEVLALLTLVSIFSGEIKIEKDKSLTLISLVLLFFFTAVYSSLIGSNFIKSFWGNFYRSDGLLTLAHLISLVIILRIIWKKSLELPFMLCVTISSFFISCWTVISASLLNIFKINTIINWNGAIPVSFGNPNYLAGFLIITLPFGIHLAKIKKNLFLGGFLLLIQSLAIYFTYSRSAIIMLFVFFAIYLLFEKSLTLKLKTALIALISIVVLAIGYIFVINHLRLRQEYRNFLPDSRERILVKSFYAGIKRPILGWGWANFDYAFEAVDWPMKYLHDFYVDKAHSTMVEIIITTGLIGFFIYISLIASTLIKLVHNKKEQFSKLLLTVFILFLIHSQTNVVSISEEIFFWMTVGIVATKYYP